MKNPVTSLFNFIEIFANTQRTKYQQQRPEDRCEHFGLQDYYCDKHS